MKTIAVFDVGKTNKKVLVYDDRLRIVDSRYRSFPARVQDGVEVEPLEQIEQWFLDTLREMSAIYSIGAVAVTTHGAACVVVDNAGRPVVPAVSYTHVPDDALHDQFYALAGSREELQQRTATYELQPLINPAKLLFFTQQRYPEQMQRAARILFYPQYFGRLLTGAEGADFTYAGCHTYLWDFERWGWSDVATRLGLDRLLPREPRQSWNTLGRVTAQMAERTGLAEGTPVTMGIHDSNASLLPYLIKMQEDFILNSTGTWCVTMHPMERVFFAPDELGKAVFYNISAFGRPVKTSILMGGLEFETYTTILKRLHNTNDLPEYNRSLYQRIIERRSHFILPSVVRGSGQFPAARPRVVEDGSVYELADIQASTRVPAFFNDLPTAYAVLNISLALQTKVALGRIGVKPGVPIYTEGGFRNNLDYNALLSALLPDNRLYLTGMAEATSFGAALTARAMLDGVEPTALGELFEIETFPIKAEEFAGLDAYDAEFLARI